MFWNRGAKYIANRMSAMQSNGWEVEHEPMIKSKANAGLERYVLNRGQERVVMVFNKKGQAVRVTGSKLKESGFASYSHPYDATDYSKFMTIFQTVV